MESIIQKSQQKQIRDIQQTESKQNPGIGYSPERRDAAQNIQI